MTVRKLWLVILMLVAVISVSINAIVLSTLTDKYFIDYVAENYDNHFNQIVKYSKKALLETDLSYVQMNIEMETHLIDPITRIELFDVKGNCIVDVSTDYSMMNNSIMKKMMNSHYKDSDHEVDFVELKEIDKVIGYLSITRYSSVKNSFARRMFKSSLIANSLYAISIVLFITLFIGVFISRKMSKDLIITAKMAQNIDLGIETAMSKTNIKEISTIQQSLETLKTRLKLKSKIRKVMIDELIHQTRTPLTVLKTHLEAYKDKIIDMTPDEITICENQIENITAIISSMSHMIDAGKDYDTIKLEEFELSLVLKQIVSGLKNQFDKKKIKLELKTNKKVNLISDRYKLSQIVYNILTNAYKYTHENGHVKISYDSGPESVCIQIEDNGVGIKENDIEKIFDAYYQGNTEIKSNGDGLGLYFAKENLKQMHGQIKVSSIVNKGSKFNIILPRNMADS